MARPIYNHELLDPDFSWLLGTFKENHPEYIALECVGIPVVLIRLNDTEYDAAIENSPAKDTESETQSVAKK